jgi:hypothetical protein
VTTEPETPLPDHVLQLPINHPVHQVLNELQCDVEEARAERDTARDLHRQVTIHCAEWRAERDEARRERDLAIAHDTQPYPTAWAYEQACRVMREREAERDALQARLDTVDEMFRECRRNYYRLVHSIGCSEDDAASEVLGHAYLLFNGNLDRKIAITKALKVIDLSEGFGDEPTLAEVRSALKGETP